VVDVDEAGFAPTLPVCYSWFPKGQRLRIPYEAPQGRRVNAIGGYFSHGPLAGRFVFRSWAQLPPHARKAKRKTPEQVAHSYGLTLEEIGAIDAARYVAFLWHLAGRPAVYAQGWKRERPLMVIVDNYSVHKSQTVQDALPELEAADIFVVSLPSYAPELSEIEPIWNAVKHHQMPTRSYQEVADLKSAVDKALQEKAEYLRQEQEKTTNLQQRAA
jgi:putative transposase